MSSQPAAMSAPERPIVHLQRTLGNQAIQRAMGSQALRTVPTVSRPGDVHEQEADRVADQIMRTPSPEAHQSSTDAPAGEPAPDRRVQGLGPGRPLDVSTRSFFEPRFGYDFGQVRVHADAKATESARGVNALAYTVGQDIVFRSGEFRPDTAAGRRLLAHELTHVRQQARSAPVPLLQRYASPEHQDIGDRYLRELLAFLQTDAGAQWAQQLGFSRDQLVAQIGRDPTQSGARIHVAQSVNAQTGLPENVELTPGEIISLMGDFYGGVDELANAPASEIHGILDIIQGERAGTISDADQRYEQITGGRYLALAQRNDTHFARLNRGEWRRLHEDAIATAQAAGREHSETLFQRALLVDAAAGHFLTDAYAAGHLFDKSEVLAAITLHLNAHPALTRNPQMQTYVGIIALAGRQPQLVLKNIHDRMNREGFEVRNDRGMHWRTFGDSYLQVAQETQRIAALAVFLSRQQIYDARSGQSPNPDDVQALMPNEDSTQRATQQALAYIPDAVAEIEGLIYRNRSLAPTQFGSVLGTIVRSNLETIGHPGREREVEQMLEGARRRGDEGGVVAPSFTLFSWH